MPFITQAAHCWYIEAYLVVAVDSVGSDRCDEELANQQA
jgi:hypothetical protein